MNINNFEKHIDAAVLFAIKTKLPSNDDLPVKNKKSLETVLARLEKQALITFILDMANRDDRIKDELAFKFAEKKMR